MLVIAAALNCEAKPIVDAWKLKKESDKPFVVYTGVTGLGEVKVLITGIGALAMAAAVGWFCGRHRVSALLNIGTAGHGQAPVGSGFVIHSVEDMLSTRKYYPPQTAKPNQPSLASDACLSLNAPTTDYPEQGLIDMEASAFFHAATRFVEAELAQAYKVVSDNPESVIEELNAQQMTELMEQHLDVIGQFSEKLMRLTSRLASEKAPDLLLPPVRTTHSQRRLFQDYADTLSRLNADPSKLQSQLQALTDMKEVLSLLQAELVSIVPSIKDMEG